MSIRDDFFTAQAKASLWDVAVSIKRGNPLPLDANSVFKALGTVGGSDYTGSLLEYATSNPVAYPGQICAVVGETATTIYYLDQNLAIQPVGIIPTGDSKTIEVTEAGAISLLGAASAANGTLPMIDSKTGKLVWKTLEDIGAGDGNDNTTYEFAFADQKITVTPKFNGVAQTAVELDLSVFVTGDELNEAIKDFVTTDTTYSVKEGEKILKLEGTEFSTVASLKYVEATADKTAQIQLCGIDGAVVSEIDATPFIRDGMLNDVTYDPNTNKLIFTWNVVEGTDEEGNIIYQKDEVVLSDIIEPYTAGNGLELSGNAFKVKVDASSESFLTVGADGVKLSGVAAAIEAAEGRAATDAQTKANTAKQAAIDDAAGKYYGKSEVYTKSETDSKIDEKIASVTGGESAADVKLALESYRDAINVELWGADAATWTTTTEEDGKTKVTYAPQYGNTSRVDTLETKVKALEDVGAQANVIEAVVKAADNRLSVTTDAQTKTVTIDDTNLRTDIAAALKAGTDAGAAAGVNASAISGHDTRIGALETAKNGFDISIKALQDADTTANGKISALETTVNNETSGVAATYAIATQNKSDIATLVTTNKTHGDDIAALKETVGGHTITLQNVNAALDNIYRKTEVYTKGEVDTAVNNAVADKITAAALTPYAKTADVEATYATKAALEAEAKRADGAEKANTALINTLIGNDSGKSARAIAADEINTMIKASDPEGGKTIEQIADLVKYADENAGQIAALITQANTSTAKLADVAEGSTVGTLIDEKIAAAAYTLPAATADKLGGIKASKSFEVAADGTVSKISTDLLVHGDLELILNGGNSGAVKAE